MDWVRGIEHTMDRGEGVLFPFCCRRASQTEPVATPPPSVSSPDEGRESISRADHPSVDRPRRRPPQDMNFNEAGKAKRGGGPRFGSLCERTKRRGKDKANMRGDGGGSGGVK